MGRGRTPRIGKIKTVVQTVQAITSQTQGSEAGASTTQQDKCWVFELEEVTPVGRNVVDGTAVRGVPDNSLIIVVSDEGALGYAPKDKSISMLKAFGNNGFLVGEVLNNQNNTPTTVQLCLM